MQCATNDFLKNTTFDTSPDSNGILFYQKKIAVRRAKKVKKDKVNSGTEHLKDCIWSAAKKK